MTDTLDRPLTAVSVHPQTIEKVAIVISKGSLEGIYPGLIMANGARMEGIEANVFFTFFGLEAIRTDRQHKIKAVMIVHNETSTGCVTHPLDVRKIMDRVKHPALLMVDTISGLGSLEYEHDAWGIDVSVAGSQKGLMLPPGLGFNAVSEKALAVAKANPAMRSYWDWHDDAHPKLRRNMHTKIGTPAGRAALRAFGVRMPEHWDEPESPEEVIGKIAPTPVIIVHGTDDKLFPPSHAQRLFDAAGEPKRLLLGEGFGHAEDGLSPAFANKLVSVVHESVGWAWSG